MKHAAPGMDLVTGLALASAVAMALVRPQSVSAIRRRLPAGRSLLPSRGRPTARRQLESPLISQALQDLIARYAPAPRSGRKDVSRRATRSLNGSAAILAASVLADCSVEHYRGSFENRAMYIPLAAAAVTLAASLGAVANPQARRHVVRDTIYASAAATGLVGLAFHAYNILKRPGGLSWSNLFYAAPVGAPAALTLAGLLGFGAERLRVAGPWRRTTALGISAGRALAALASVGLAGTVGEAGLLHFRGNFQNPAMLLPVTVPPVASALLAAAALRPNRVINGIARWWLRLTVALGIGGVGFHAYGISRAMGGWRNWSQNLLNGPPLPAPPSFAGLAVAGLAALSLLDEEIDG